MSDPFSWSLPFGRLFGITIRVHVLFPIVAIALILRAGYKGAVPGTWLDMAMMVALLLVIVLLHEFGHCFGARLVDGDAHQILIWPLGGLASIDVPHTPRANFIATAAGPLANVAICVAAGLALGAFCDGIRPPFNPFTWSPFRLNAAGAIEVFKWGNPAAETSNQPHILILMRTFYLSWILFLLNLLPGFPLDGGRMFQCLLWPRYGFRQSMIAAIFAGFLVAIVVGIASMVIDEVFVLFLAIWIYVTCRQQWILLETGGEESVFGYDFSQGYTSLERDQPTPRRRRPGFFQQWRQRRRARKMQRDEEARLAEGRRMDELLEKVSREGLQALTDEERRFMKRVSEKFKNRH
jgi:Zn-dependent protease